ncbi:MAG: peptidoglycan glycosyltransferase [Ruminococcus sp.]|nr:peptidoglycan glycosyltransferase [Ruminococcus sp.]
MFFLTLALFALGVSCSPEEQQSSEEIPVQATTAETAVIDTYTEIPTQTLQAVVTETTTTTAESTTTETTTTATTSNIIKGNIYDTNGYLLMYTAKGEDGKMKRKVNAEYAVPFANIITEMSDGYDKHFNDILSKPASPDSKRGQSIQLTIDADVQTDIYNYMESMNIEGSAVVMRTDGSIVAQVSYPSYDPDKVKSQEYDEELAWGEYGNKAFQNFEPGSCFKIMSEVISDKHGIYSVYDDGEWTDEGATIVNWDHDTNMSYPIPDRNLYSAFTSSSNIFFAKAFDQIGQEDVLFDLDYMFSFISGIECDFGSIHNNIKITCADDLRRSAFGQAYVLTCPIYLAALGREAVFGDMVEPFVIQNIVDSENPKKILRNGTAPNQTVASIPVEYRQNLLDGMLGVASGLAVYPNGNYTFYAKTGTAETWKGDFLYITGCICNPYDVAGSTYNYDTYKSDGGSYTIVMQIRNPEDHGFEYASESGTYYTGIVNAVLANQN